MAGMKLDKRLGALYNLLLQLRILRNGKRGAPGVGETRKGRLSLGILGAVLLLLIFGSFLLGRYPVPPVMLVRVLVHKLLLGLGSLLGRIIPSAASW